MLRNTVRTSLYFPNFTANTVLSDGKIAETATNARSSALLPYQFGTPLNP